MRELQRELLAWYRAKQRDLPWRRSRDPWAIWVSEVMLQQTRVETVIPYYGRFLARFPDAQALAEAPIDDVLAMWSGLGYYRRARLLHAGAQAVRTRGAMPSNRTTLLDVPGIGRYTAGAIASIAFGEAVGLVDGNVARVLARIFAIDDDMRKAGARKAEALADAIVVAEDPGAWNQALMELGATVCTPRNPACPTCPVANVCAARAQNRVAELPFLSAKKPPTEARVQALVASKGASVLLARRRGDRLFGGLWEPPSLDGATKAKAALLEAFGIAAADADKAGRVVHVLSHRKLTVDVHTANLARVPKEVPSALAETYDELRLVSVDTEAFGALGIATLARKILAAARIAP